MTPQKEQPAPLSSVKVKSGKSAVKVKGPAELVKPVVDQIQLQNGTLPSPGKFRYKATGEK